MNKPYISHEEATIESFKKDPDYAAEYLKAVLGYGDQEELMIALRCITDTYSEFYQMWILLAVAESWYYRLYQHLDKRIAQICTIVPFVTHYDKYSCIVAHVSGVQRIDGHSVGLVSVYAI